MWKMKTKGPWNRAAKYVHQPVILKGSWTETFAIANVPKVSTFLHKCQIPSGPMLDQCREDRETYADDEAGNQYNVDL